MRLHRLPFCLLQYEDRNRFGGLSVAYTAEKVGDRWKPTFQEAGS